MNSLTVFLQVQDRELERMILGIVKEEDYSVKTFCTCEEVLSAIQRNGPPDLLLLEPADPSRSPLDVYGGLFRSQPAMRVACIVRPGDSYRMNSIRALAGVDVITKPVMRRDLEVVLESARHQRSITRERPENPTPRFVPRRAHGGALVSEPVLEELNDNRFFLAYSPAMLEIYRQVKLLEGIDVSVLILGESGTGKEIIAHLIHKHSRRAQQKFVNVNCAALPMDLLESELFGHMKGAFTGAVTDKPGRFEQASGGTILLDEIGEISSSMQAKLLHVLQDGQFTRLGARQPTRVDVHVLAATNIAIEHALAMKTFREDLYYRLNTFTINVPPLRERAAEIPYLVNEMIARTPIAQNSGITHFSREVMELLPEYSWPGNLRELRSFVLRTIIMQDEEAAKLDLEIKINKARTARQRVSEVDTVRSPAPMRSVVRDVRGRTEIRMIEAALYACAWNRRDAARSLNISYRALLYKIQQYGLNPRAQRVVG